MGGRFKIWKIYSLFFGRGNFKLKLCTLFWGKKISNWTYIPLFGGISNFEICTLFFGRGNSKLEICTPFRVREIMYPFGVRKISNWKYIPFYRGREFQIVKSYTFFREGEFQTGSINTFFERGNFGKYISLGGQGGFQM